MNATNEEKVKVLFGEKSSSNDDFLDWDRFVKAFVARMNQRNQKVKSQLKGKGGKGKKSSGRRHSADLSKELKPITEETHESQPGAPPSTTDTDRSQQKKAVKFAEASPKSARF